jgi:hypothetical protein
MTSMTYRYANLYNEDDKVLYFNWKILNALISLGVSGKHQNPDNSAIKIWVTKFITYRVRQLTWKRECDEYDAELCLN